jgi:uroporphyrinogen III methyltransferase/synthase
MVGDNRLLHLLEGVRIASIGPITSRACSELGLKVDIEPAEHTVEALTREIVRSFYPGFRLKTD